MTWWKMLIAALIVLAVGGMTFAGLREKPPPATEVQFGKVKKGPITRTVTGAGKVEAATTVKTKIPASAKVGIRYKLMILTKGKEPKLIEQPVRFEVEE